MAGLRGNAALSRYGAVTIHTIGGRLLSEPAL